MRDIQEVLSHLSRSPFRSRIHLREKELDYLRSKGMDEVLKHAANDSNLMLKFSEHDKLWRSTWNYMMMT